MSLGLLANFCIYNKIHNNKQLQNFFPVCLLLPSINSPKSASIIFTIVNCFIALQWKILKSFFISGFSSIFQFGQNPSLLLAAANETKYMPKSKEEFNFYPSNLNNLFLSKTLFSASNPHASPFLFPSTSAAFSSFQPSFSCTQCSKEFNTLHGLQVGSA